MPFTMPGIKSFIKTFFIILTAIYPICVFLCLVVFNLPVRIISLCIMLFACMYFLSASGAKKSVRPIISSALLLTAGILCYITNKTFFLKMYSVTVSVFFLFRISNSTSARSMAPSPFSSVTSKRKRQRACKNEAKVQYKDVL